MNRNFSNFKDAFTNDAKAIRTAPNLLDLVMSDKWESPERIDRTRYNFNVGIGVHSVSKKTGSVNIRILFTKEIMEELGWTQEDKICIMHHEDDAFALKLFKVENSRGNKIFMQNKRYYVSYTWTYKNVPFQYKDKKLKHVEYVVYKKQLALDARIKLD